MQREPPPTQLPPCCRECETSPVVRFDDDTFIDYRARRPIMELRDGVNTDLRGTTIELGAGRSPSGRDVLVLDRPEPDMAWRRFVELRRRARRRTRCHADGRVRRLPVRGTPHAHASPVVLVTVHRRARQPVSSPAVRSTYRPGMAAALEHTMQARKIPTLGIWVQVPHYVAAMPYPASSVALLDGLDRGDRHRRRRGRTAQRGRDPTAAHRSDGPGQRRPRCMVNQLEALHDAAVEDEADAADTAARCA